MAIGIVSSGLCLCNLFFIGIAKQIFGRMRDKLKWSPFLKEVLPPFIGGISIGEISLSTFLYSVFCCGITTALINRSDVFCLNGFLITFSVVYRCNKLGTSSDSR